MQALAGDDEVALMTAINKACDALQIESSHLLMMLEQGLWRPSRGTGPGGNPRGLIAVAAGNRQGVPECGAIRCLQELLLRFPNAWNARELSWALERAKELGRVQVVALLAKVLSGVDSLHDALLYSPSHTHQGIPEV